MKAKGNAPHVLKCSSKMCLFHHNRPSQLIAYVLFAAYIVVTCYLNGKAEGRRNIPHLNLHQVFISPHQTLIVDCYLNKAWVSNMCFALKKIFPLLSSVSSTWVTWWVMWIQENLSEAIILTRWRSAVFNRLSFDKMLMNFWNVKGNKDFSAIPLLIEMH